MNLSIIPGTNNVGAYIKNLKLNDLQQNIISEIKDILNNYGVVIFKRQNLTTESYQKFAKSIGKLVEYPRLKGLENFRLSMY